MVYQSLCGLMPLLAAPGGGTQGRGPPFVKLTVPLVELTVQAMRSTLAILQDLHISAEEVCTRFTLVRTYLSLSRSSTQPVSADTALPSVTSLVVTEHYSSWQCTQMLFSHLPLIKILFNILTHSCKKVHEMHVQCTYNWHSNFDKYMKYSGNSSNV